MVMKKWGPAVLACFMLIILSVSYLAFSSNEDAGAPSSKGSYVQTSHYGKELYENELPFSAWDGIMGEENPVPDPSGYKDSQLRPDELSKICMVDGTWELTQTQGNADGYPYQHYMITAKREGVIQLALTGWGTQPFMREHDNICPLYIYDHSLEQWYEVLSFEREGKSSSSFLVESTALWFEPGYISASSEINLLITGPFGAGDCTSTLAIDHFTARTDGRID